jgi:hypothetical protein
MQETNLVEGIVFGLVSGPVCLLSCLPVLLPWLTVRQQSTTRSASVLGSFLAGRLVAYLMFGSLAWSLGLLVSAQSEQRAIVYGIAHLAVAGTLFYEAWQVSHARPHCGECGVGSAPQSPDAAPAILGLLTGLNLCPPFVAAGLRASSSPSLEAALLFFLLFFVGTSVWIMPLSAMKWIPRSAKLLTISLYAVLLMACYFFCLGLIELGTLVAHA